MAHLKETKNKIRNTVIREKENLQSKGEEKFKSTRQKEITRTANDTVQNLCKLNTEAAQRITERQVNKNK
jgi:hypothetical protein